MSDLVFIALPPLLQTLMPMQNEAIRTCVTCSAVMPRLAPELMEAFVLDEWDRAVPSHNTERRIRTT